MKKINKLFILMLTLLFVFCFTGCTGCSNSGSPDEATEDNEFLCFSKIEGEEYLYYQNDTKIVYIVDYRYGTYSSYSFSCPYYSTNGYLCKYIDNQIVEIEHPVLIPNDDTQQKNETREEEIVKVFTNTEINSLMSSNFTYIEDSNNLYYNTGNFVVYEMKNNNLCIYYDDKDCTFYYDNGALKQFILQ